MTSLLFNSNGTILLSGSWDGTIKLWNVNAKTEIATLYESEISINSIAFNNNETVLAIGANSHTIKFIKLEKFVKERDKIDSI